MDRLPKYLHERSRDWSDLLATRQLAEPLFVEARDRGLESRLVAECVKLNEHVWRLRLDRDAPFAAEDVAGQINRARAALAAGLLPALMLLKIDVENERDTLLTTRFPLAALERLLASPALAPWSGGAGRTSGSHRLVADEDVTRLRAIDGGRELHLVEHDPASGRDRFDEGEAHVSGPMCVPPSRWPSYADDPDAFLLDFCFVLMAPLNVSLAGIRLKAETVVDGTMGMVRPAERMSHCWADIDDRVEEIRSVHLVSKKDLRPVVEFAGFSGNREMAMLAAGRLTSITGLEHFVQERPYADLMARPRPDDCYRLGIVSSPWPHPAALLCPFLFVADVAPEARQDLLASLAENNLDTAITLAARAEALLDLPGRGIAVIGQPPGLMRSRTRAVWCPPSGWLDYSTL